MTSFAEKHPIVRNKIFVQSLLFAFALLAVSFVINYFAGEYANKMASSSVADIVLSNTRAYDVDGAFIYGPFIFWFFIIVLGLRDPKKIPFTVKSVTVFMLIRSAFICMTHLGPFPTQALIHGQNIFVDFSKGNDFFFSAHTGLPFLMALVFWNDFRVRVICLATSLFFGVVVLLGHFHYTIDVFSAFFITYSIYHLAVLFFKRDRAVFFHGLQALSEKNLSHD